MKNRVRIGLDVGKLKFSAAPDLPGEHGRLKPGVLPQKNFEHTPSGVDALFSRAETIASGLEKRIVMETTGCYSQEPAQWIALKYPDTKESIINA